MIEDTYEASTAAVFGSDTMFTETPLLDDDFGNTVSKGYIRVAVPSGIVGNGTINREVGTLSVSIPSRPTLSLSIDNSAEGVVLSDDYYYNFTSNAYDSEEWTQGSGNVVTVEPKTNIYIYKVATEETFKSAVQTLPAPARRTDVASLKLVKDYPNVASDGRIVNVTTEMEYRLQGTDTWTACTGTEITGLTAGTYEVRYPATDTEYASESTTINIEEAAVTGTQNTDNLTYGDNGTLSVADQNGSEFSDVTYKWYQQTDDSWIEISGADASTYTTSTLDVGTYNFKCEITGSNFVYTWQFTEFTIAQAKPEITTVTAERNEEDKDTTIYSTTDLANVTLSGTATGANDSTVKGTFTFADSVTELSVGTQDYACVFTPDAAETNYQEVEGTVSITVVQNEVTSIEVSTEPTKTAYTYGDTFDLSGAVITATYADGTTDVVTDDVTFDDTLATDQISVELSYTYFENGKEINTVTTNVTDISVTYLTAPTTILYNGGEEKTWYGNADITNGGITITAEGYTISDTLNGTYTDRYTLVTEGTATKTLYFKNASGQMTGGVAVDVQYDFSAPTYPENGGIIIKDNFWKSLLNTITFGLAYSDETVDVTVKAEDEGSGIAAYYYYVDTTGSTTVLTAEELNEQTFTEADSATIASISAEGKYVYYVYVIDNAGNKSGYICSDGVLIERTAPADVKVEVEKEDVSAAITITATETGSGMDTCYLVYGTSELINDVTKDSITTYDGVLTSETNSFALTGLEANTTYYYAVAVSDKAGNVSEVTPGSFTTKKTVPTFEDANIPTISGTYGQTLGSMTLSKTTDTSKNSIAGTWSITETGAASIYPTVGANTVYEITFTPDNETKYDVYTQTVVPMVVQKELTISVTATDRDYEKGNNKVDIEVILSGIVGSDNVSLENANSLQGTLSGENAGTYDKVTLPTLTLTGDAAYNYSLSQSSGEVTLESEATIAKLDGTITVGTDSYSKTYGDADFTLDVTDNNPEADVTYTSSNEDVVTVSNGTVTIKSAGKATITVSLVESTNYNAAKSKNITVNVAKKSGYTIEEMNRNYYYARENADSINIAALLPTDCGTVSYGIPTTTTGVTFSETPSVTDGVFSYKVASGAVNATGKITFNVITQNYEDITITVNLTLIDQIPVSLKEGTEVTLKNNTLTYGEPLSKLEFNTAVFVADGNEVTGTLAWKEPSVVPNAGTTSATWVFTPKDEAYAALEGTVAITVNKATPVVSVNATEITYGDTLGKSVLSGLAQYSDTDSTAVSGSFAWKDDSAKPAVADSDKTEYTVVFTPDDTENYNTVETTITLTVNKAETAPDMPESTMSVLYSTGTVGEVTLPDDWAWQDSDKTVELKAEVPVTATAVYTGTDAGNYENESIKVSITRQACTENGTTEQKTEVTTATTSESTTEVSTATETSERKTEEATATTSESTTEVATATSESTTEVTTATTSEEKTEVATATTSERTTEVSTATTSERKTEVATTTTTSERTTEEATATTSERKTEEATTTTEGKTEIATTTTEEKTEEATVTTTSERTTEEATTEQKTEVATVPTTSEGTTEVVTTETTTSELPTTEQRTEEPTTEKVTEQTTTQATTSEIKVNKVKIEENVFTLAIKKKKKIKAVVSPSNAKNKKLTYSSSNKTVATVDANGTVTAVTPGIATIRVKAASGVVAKVTVKVKPDKVTGLKKIKVSNTKIKIIWKKQNKVTGYKVYRWNKKMQTYKLYKITKNNYVSVANIKKNTTYKFKVKAYKRSSNQVVNGDNSKAFKLKMK